VTLLTRLAPRARQLLQALLVLLPARLVGAQNANPDPQRFASEIQAFADWDAKNAAPRHSVVFAGSSSIRLWNTAARFPDLPMINRGFGGAHLSDVNVFIRETVLRYTPRIVVLYAGDNDLADGKTNERVVADYETFVTTVHAADAATDIIYIPIKPSLQRWALWSRIQAVNAQIRSYAASHAHLHYVDVATPMLGADGKPRPELFVEDGLHMTPAGYDVWTTALTAYLQTLRGVPRR
jgi:lysophospholipase L1-like esterase